MECPLSICLRKSTEAHSWAKMLSMGHPRPCRGQMDRIWRNYHGWETQDRVLQRRLKTPLMGGLRPTERICRCCHQLQPHLGYTHFHSDFSENTCLAYLHSLGFTSNIFIYDTFLTNNSKLECGRNVKTSLDIFSEVGGCHPPREVSSRAHSHLSRFWNRVNAGGTHAGEGRKNRGTGH